MAKAQRWTKGRRPPSAAVPKLSIRLPSGAQLWAILFLAPLLLVIFLQPFRAITDSDYWWHVRTGQYIVETGRLPRVDPFSFTANGRPWTTHEWLTEVILFAVARQFGYVGNLVLFSLIGLFSWLAVYATCRRRGIGEVGAALLVLWGFLMALTTANVRPQALTVLLVAVTAWLLTRYKQGETRAIWPLPLIFVLWANLHGGYIIGLVLLGLTVAGEALARGLRRPAAPLRTLLAVTALSTVATLLTPHGLEALRYPFSYAGTANAHMQLILEWQSPNFHQTDNMIFGASLLLVFVLGVWRAPLGPSEVLWVLVFALMGLQSIRHIPLYAVIATPLLAARLQAELPAFPRRSPKWLRPGILIATGPLLLGILLVARLVAANPRGLQLGWEPGTATYPAGAVAYLRQRNLPGNIYNDYRWGGYLIHQLYPQRSVFIDGRADVYGDALMQRYQKVKTLGPNWRQVLDEYDIRLALVPRSGLLAAELSQNDDWQVAYTGQVERLFVRRSR